jgi:HAMP domain-containing protein
MAEQTDIATLNRLIINKQQEIAKLRHKINEAEYEIGLRENELTRMERELVAALKKEGH